jgi:hypothetical protein
MYEALDDFLNEDTWTSRHWADNARFFKALDKIIRQPGFSEAEMGQCIERRYVKQYGDRGDDKAQRIGEEYVEKASVVRQYLQAIGQLGG